MMKIAQLRLGVSDLAQSERFYRDALGLNAERSGYDVVVRWPGFVLTLIENPPADRAKFQFGFKVESRADVDEWSERLRKSGAQIVAGPAENNGVYRLFVLDPDSYEIEIFSE